MHMNKATAIAIVIIALIIGVEIFYALNKNSIGVSPAAENAQAYTAISVPK